MVKRLINGANTGTIGCKMDNVALFHTCSDLVTMGVHLLRIVQETMKKGTEAIILMLLLFALCGCDPGYVLYVHNRSGAARQIRVIYTAATMKQEMVRSPSPLIRFYSTLGNGKVIKQNPLRVLRKDSITMDWAHTYSFLLPARQTAGIEGGIGGPLKQLIIVDGRDSISTITGSSRLRSRKFFFPLHFVQSIDIDD